MARKISALVQLSTAELKKLLAARERIDVLEAERTRLERELGAVERELKSLLGGEGKVPARGRKAAGKKTAKKKAVKKKTVKKTAARKTAKKAAAAKAASGRTKKKTVRKVAKKAAKKTTGKTAKKAPRKAAAKGGRVRLEDVIVAVLREAGGKMAYKDLHETIVKGKRFATRASNFDNVLRRTLSTSKAVKRVGRGVYAPA
jgi:hypothetical protein